MDGKMYMLGILCITFAYMAQVHGRLRRNQAYALAYNTHEKVVPSSSDIHKKESHKKSSQDVSQYNFDAGQSFVDHESMKDHTLIRVLIKESSMDKTCSWSFSAPEGCVVACPETHKSYRFDDKDIHISYKKDHFYINKRIYPHKKMMIIPLKGSLSYEKGQYHGSFMLSTVEKYHKAYLVNYVDIEDYVLSIIPGESWPGWPKEVNKAFCICFRSYALSKILERRRAVNKKSILATVFDIKNTNIHQTYKGYKNNPQFKQAVDETKGMILAYDNKPISAMFDSCCGGVIPSHLSGLNFVHAPYLQRSYPCTYCDGCFLYTWNKSLTVQDFKNRLKKSHKQIDVRDVKVTRIDKAGKVLAVKIKTPVKWIEFSGKDFYSLFPEIKSFCYSVSKRKNMITFTGKGYGHHVGLCQWGAYHMIKKGWDYKSVLQFYYPYARFMKLSVKG
jgi:SpoIID/LytB domain protein